MPLNPSGAISLAGPVAGQSIAVELGQSATATISLNDTNVRTLAQVPSGVIVMPTDFWGKSNISIIPVQRGMIAFGFAPGPPLNRPVNTVNLVSNTGVVASDTTSPASASTRRSSASYGTDKGIFAFGSLTAPAVSNIINLVSNTGVIASNTTAPTDARNDGSGAVYGGDKAIFNFGRRASSVTPAAARNITTSNLVSNTGVMASDTPTVAVANYEGQAAPYGNGAAIFGFGFYPSVPVVQFNLVSNTGVFAATTATTIGVRSQGSMTTYGGDKAIYAFGLPRVPAVSNLISNTGVIASNTPIVASPRTSMGSGTPFGGDRGLIYGGISNPSPFTYTNQANIISNTGVVASDSPAIGQPRSHTSGVGYSST